MKLIHDVAYYEKGIFAGWPANHGAWSWGKEMLVGFLRGKYKAGQSMHKIIPPYEKCFLRTPDDGATWQVEKPSCDLECASVSTATSRNTDEDIYRVCGVYDHGGDNCYDHGGFYSSPDRGKNWYGPFGFTGTMPWRAMEGTLNTSRTSIVGDLWFLSAGQAAVWGTDHTFVARYNKTSGKFRYVGAVCIDEARAVMPAVAVLGEIYYCALRRRKSGKREGWIDVFTSDDGGCTWHYLSYVGSTGSHNGNPPALLALPDGRLLCAFGNRDHGALHGAISEDLGQTWRSLLLRPSESDSVDLGYPQLLLRTDGVPICLYYWTSYDLPEQHIAMTIIKDL